MQSVIPWANWLIGMHGCTHVPHWEGMCTVCHSLGKLTADESSTWMDACSSLGGNVFSLLLWSKLSSLRTQMCVQSSNTSVKQTVKSSNSDVRAIQQHFYPAFEFKCTYNPATLLHLWASYVRISHPSIHLDTSSNTVPRLHATSFLLHASSCADKT